MIAIFLGFVLVCSLTVAALRVWHPDRAQETAATPHQEVSKKQETAKDSPAKTNEASSPSVSPSPAPASSSPACKKFTKSLADQALGADAILNTKDSSVTSETADLQISFCTYTASERAITLVSYIAKSDVGKSMNSVEFGSGRPAGVQNITTIGQAAFWNDTLATMYILKNNNRYSIALTKGSMDQTLDAAKIIIPNV